MTLKYPPETAKKNEPANAKTINFVRDNTMIQSNNHKL